MSLPVSVAINCRKAISTSPSEKPPLSGRESSVVACQNNFGETTDRLTT